MPNEWEFKYHNTYACYKGYGDKRKHIEVADPQDEDDEDMETDETTTPRKPSTCSNMKPNWSKPRGTYQASSMWSVW